MYYIRSINPSFYNKIRYFTANKYHSTIRLVSFFNGIPIISPSNFYINSYIWSSREGIVNNTRPILTKEFCNSTLGKCSINMLFKAVPIIVLRWRFIKIISTQYVV